MDQNLLHNSGLQETMETYGKGGIGVCWATLQGLSPMSSADKVGGLFWPSFI